ncbi:hypothetical protein MES5069_230222 [Mesorhizobium escarrei]|uniref:Uncharacterized protein n=1 Tax=Mesorhizobium escarrei TaxID=666018 RepID=A0ABM9DUN6_9HYPH|nr:hypothetical protein MES5069_230222 [Mesorhizobium escarrei]
MVLLADVIVFSFGETEHVGIQAKPAAPRMVPGALVGDRWILVPTSKERSDAAQTLGSIP